MSRFVTDTHALHWHLTQDEKLSPRARLVFQGADQGLSQVLVPAIALIEMVYLVEKGRIDAVLVERLIDQLDALDGSYRVAPLELGVVRALRHVPRSLVPDMPDRIITAAAYYHGLPLITRDQAIVNAGVIEVLW